MMPRDVKPLTDDERARIVARGYMTVAEFAREMSTSRRHIGDLVNQNLVRHSRWRTSPDAKRDMIRIPVTEVEDFKKRTLVPLADEVIAS